MTRSAFAPAARGRCCGRPWPRPSQPARSRSRPVPWCRSTPSSGYTTMLILPEGEDILDIICGDKDFWVVSGVQNFAYVKPAKAGAAPRAHRIK